MKMPHIRVKAPEMESSPYLSETENIDIASYKERCSLEEGSFCTVRMKGDKENAWVRILDSGLGGKYIGQVDSVLFLGGEPEDDDPQDDEVHGIQCGDFIIIDQANIIYVWSDIDTLRYFPEDVIADFWEKEDVNGQIDGLLY